jgi:hypothetical protein
VEVEETEGRRRGLGDKREAAAKRPEKGEGSETHRDRGPGTVDRPGGCQLGTSQRPPSPRDRGAETDTRSQRQTDTRQTTRQRGDKEGASEAERPHSQA